MTCHSLRIKGILDKGHEVVRSAHSVFVSYLSFLSQELELLSVRESVELLSAVAQLDTSEVSPCMIEIVRHHAMIADDWSSVTDCCVCVCLNPVFFLACLIVVLLQAQLCGRLPVHHTTFV